MDRSNDWFPFALLLTALSIPLMFIHSEKAHAFSFRRIPIGAAPSPTPKPSATPVTTPRPSATPASSPVATPRPSTTPTGGAASATVYGVTLDNVSNAIMPAIIASFQHLNQKPTARVVFDEGVSASYYQGPLQSIKPHSYIMGQLSDSTGMKSYTTGSYQTRTRSYLQTLGTLVDVWEIGNEVNGNWLGSGTIDKVQVAFDELNAKSLPTALTFFYMGEPNDPNNCIDSPGNDVFSWITTQFQLNLVPSARNQAREKMRLGLDQVLLSWYPQGCNNIQPDWTTVFNRLAVMFPNSKLGFGEIGTANAQGGSTYEANLIRQFYPLASKIPLPSRYIGGYYWWYYAEEMLPYQTSTLFPILNSYFK
jgi:hypothetical protein